MDNSEPTWIKSSFSGAAGHCVEMARTGSDTFLMRDSKNPDGPVLTFNQAEISAYLDGAKDGEFDNL